MCRGMGFSAGSGTGISMRGRFRAKLKARKKEVALEV
jgi:hypothetical protein